MSGWQIGTSETGGCIGSRAARSTTLDEAIDECQTYSRARHVKQAWLRPYEGVTLGEVIITFVKGRKVK